MSADKSFHAILAKHLTRVSDMAKEVAHAIEQLQDGEIGEEEFYKSLADLKHRVENIRRLAGAIRERMVRQPALKVWGGKPLTEQEYYFARAAGVHINTAHQLGLSPVDEYALYRHLCYEDDQVICYINPGPQQAKADGSVPEQLHAHNLRPEQKAFLEKHLPEVLTRFQVN